MSLERTDLNWLLHALQLNYGALAILIGLSGLGVFRWQWILLGWGGAAVILSLLEMRRDR